jgi:hypothetical protein
MHCFSRNMLVSFVGGGSKGSRFIQRSIPRGPSNNLIMFVPFHNVYLPRLTSLPFLE